MKKKASLFVIFIMCALVLCACGKKEEPAVAASAELSTPAEPSAEVPASREPSQERSSREMPPMPTAVPTSVPTPVPTAIPTPAPTAAPTPVPTPVPTAVPTPAPTAVPTAAPVEIRAGTYKDADGSELTVKKDGTVSYKTEVSGTVNGSPMSGMLTFSGTVEDGEFSFTKVSYGPIDLTEVAKANGLGDPTPWENAAMALYKAQVK